MKATKQAQRAGIIGMLVAGLVVSLAGSATAVLRNTWSFEGGEYSNVDGAYRTWEERQNAGNSGRTAYQLSVRHPRGAEPRGKAEAAIATRFPFVTADGITVDFFGKPSEAANDPMAKIKVYVLCQLDELTNDWSYLGQQDVAPSTVAQTITEPITVEDCETRAISGVMIQVIGGDRHDRKTRTVFLSYAKLTNGSINPVWEEVFHP